MQSENNILVSVIINFVAWIYTLSMITFNLDVIYTLIKTIFSGTLSKDSGSFIYTIIAPFIFLGILHIAKSFLTNPSRTLVYPFAVYATYFYVATNLALNVVNFGFDKFPTNIILKLAVLLVGFGVIFIGRLFIAEYFKKRVSI